MEILFKKNIFLAEKSEAFSLYQNVREQGEKLTNWIFILLLRIFPCIAVLPTVGWSIFLIICGNFDASTWPFSYPMEVPFDVSTIAGWYMRTFIYAYGCCVYYFISLAIIPYLVTCWLYISACCKHYQLVSDECDEIICAKSTNRLKQIEKMTEKMNIAIAFHMTILE